LKIELSPNNYLFNRPLLGGNSFAALNTEKQTLPKWYDYFSEREEMKGSVK
jgi:hypothetical protein